MLENKYEKECWAKDSYLMGIDEAGRGPLCGPLVVACCVLPIGYENEGIDDSKKLSPKKREELLSYLREFRAFDELTMPDGRRFVLTHSGIEGFDPEIPLSEYPLDALINARPNLGDSYYRDRTLIFGHTPTLTYPEMQGRAEVLFADTYINIDCGAVFHEVGGKLACLRLDDMKVFYV